ncbi:hypothetical protein ACHAXN_009597 [Cyclotella atomus]
MSELWDPHLTQQRALAYAPKPLAFISFVASSYLIYNLTYLKPQKCRRMYHRLVLALNIAGLPLSVSWIWGNWAVPEDNPNTVGAAGSIQTCTAQGWLNLLFSQTVAVYYASLGVYSYFAIKNNFKQEQFKWIEKWIHLVAYVLPTILCSVVTVHESFNPRGTGCFIAASPFLCEKDHENIDCDRGGMMSDVFIGH